MNVARRTFLGLSLLFALSPSSLLAKEPGQPVKLLTIGNSFAGDATAYLPAMAQAGGKDLLIFRANPGGCTFERHAKALLAFELNPADPKGRLYKNGWFPVRKDAPKAYSLQEILGAEKWDYVTIQQASKDSYKYETFEPYAKTVIDCIRKHAPTAEILIHQTWAYREDYSGFADGTLNQKLMFDGLVAAYGKLSDAYKLRIIPVGTAMQNARALPRWTFIFPDPDFNYKEPLPGTKPKQVGSLNVGWTVKKSEKTGKYISSLDFKHCNPDGRFLGASVFYGFLFGEKAVANGYRPPAVKPEDAVLLREVADRTLAAVQAPVTTKLPPAN